MSFCVFVKCAHTAYMQCMCLICVICKVGCQQTHRHTDIKYKHCKVGCRCVPAVCTGEEVAQVFEGSHDWWWLEWKHCQPTPSTCPGSDQLPCFERTFCWLVAIPGAFKYLLLSLLAPYIRMCSIPHPTKIPSHPIHIWFILANKSTFVKICNDLFSPRRWFHWIATLQMKRC